MAQWQAHPGKHHACLRVGCAHLEALSRLVLVQLTRLYSASVCAQQRNRGRLAASEEPRANMPKWVTPLRTRIPHDNNFRSTRAAKLPVAAGPQASAHHIARCRLSSQRPPSANPSHRPPPLRHRLAQYLMHTSPPVPRGLVGAVRYLRSPRIGPPVADASATSAAAPPTKRRRPLPTHQ
eukprot:59053-Prorocentrum_minimum.AAC.1